MFFKFLVSIFNMINIDGYNSYKQKFFEVLNFYVVPSLKIKNLRITDLDQCK